MRRKYGNVKITVDGITYDSKKEARRANELRLLEKAEKISNLRQQVKFVLIPTQREVIHLKNGKTKPGKVLEREISYTADFVYTDNETGETVVEDTKGVKTVDYVMRRKMMLYFHGIRVKEI